MHFCAFVNAVFKFYNHFFIFGYLLNAINTKVIVIMIQKMVVTVLFILNVEKTIVMITSHVIARAAVRHKCRYSALLRNGFANKKATSAYKLIFAYKMSVFIVNKKIAEII